MKRGDVWFVNFDPTIGDEIRKTRPAVIVNDDAVGTLDLRVIVPITSWHDDFSDSPWLVRLTPTSANGLVKVSTADAFQVKSLSTQRFIRRLGTLSQEEMDKVSKALSVVLGTY
ncbi:MAG: type II toxin-antitoxin system PemK/MazF family toxin [Bacteroidota bacterium]|jgi:mRNA interferase MazF